MQSSSVVLEVMCCLIIGDFQSLDLTFQFFVGFLPSLRNFPFPCYIRLTCIPTFLSDRDSIQIRFISQATFFSACLDTIITDGNPRTDQNIEKMDRGSALPPMSRRLRLPTTKKMALQCGPFYAPQTLLVTP